MIAVKPKLSPCPWCAGTCRVPTGHGVDKCRKCDGGGYALVPFDLGATRTYPKGRPALWNPGTGDLSVTRNKKATPYHVSEYEPDQIEAAKPIRAFRFEKLSEFGRVLDTHYVCVGAPEQTHCTCTGFVSDATQKGNERAWTTGEPVAYLTFGCLHVDAVKFLLTNDLFPVRETHKEIA